MPVQLTLDTLVTVLETLAGNPASAPDSLRKVTHSNFNTHAVLSATTTPPVTKVAAFEQALVGGAGSIDLTALVGTNGATVDGTGLKVQAIKLKAKSTNTAGITISKGVSNGYALAGANYSEELKPGQEVTRYGNNATPAIAGGAKTLDLAGTGTDALQVIVVMG